MSLTEIKHALAGLPERKRGSVAAWLLESLPPHSGEDATEEGSQKLHADMRSWIQAASNQYRRMNFGLPLHESAPRGRSRSAQVLRGHFLPAGDEFQAEVREVISQAAGNPLRFHLTQRGFRRANLRRFPYHILCEVHSDCLRVMHIRHNKRHPDYGIERR